MFWRALVLMLICNNAHAQFTSSASPGIAIANVRTFCLNRSIPYLQAEIVINHADQGLPGVLYVGVLDDARQQPYFLASTGWMAWSSGMVPAYSVQRQGLVNTTVTLNLASLPPLPGISIYMGYGALTPAAEKTVQAGIEAGVAMRRKFPDRAWPPMVEPDHHRLALVQDDMTRNAKYRLVLAAYDFPRCDGGE